MMSFPASLRDFQSLSAQQWLDRASRTLPRALSIILVIAIAWQLVQLTWLLLGRAAPGDATAVVTQAPAATSRRQGVDVQAIASAHLFGQPETGSQAPTDAPETQMNLALSAVFATSDPQKGWAIIGESPQSAKVYSAGQTVRPGTKLHSVFADRVILEREGQLEALALPKRSGPAVAINRPPPPARPSNQFADNLRRIAENNPGAIMEVIRPQPVFADGVQRGYRVYPGRNRQQFAKLGLQPGDLITSINGTPLSDPQRGMEIFNTIGSSDRVTVTIERSGQSQELTLNTAQIALPDADAQPPAPGEQRPQVQPPAFTPSPE